MAVTSVWWCGQEHPAPFLPLRSVVAGPAAPSASTSALNRTPPLAFAPQGLAHQGPVDAAPRPGASGAVWPLAGPPDIARPFDPPPQPWRPGHRGVDLGGRPGAVVSAAAAGEVAFVGAVAGRGVVSVQHPSGLRTTYEPVTGTVAVGDRVDAGSPVGRLDAGHAGCARPACLHWGLRRDRQYLDPLAMLGLGRSRLLP
uniref:M23 family metallopeptidase n=1 Tax=Pilimelia terevasa TaxID=53372 RepID=UPI003570E51C